MPSKLPWTHFRVEKRTILSKLQPSVTISTISLYSIDKCEHCGETVEAPNTVGGCDQVSHYLSLGLTRDDRTFSEIIPVEGDGYRCDACIGAYRDSQDTDKWGSGSNSDVQLQGGVD